MTTDASLSVGGIEERSAGSRSLTCILIALAVGIHACLILTANPLQSANDRSRWCTVWSLVNRRVYHIDEIRQVKSWDSIDILYDNGHFYSTKPPLLATVVAGIVEVIERTTGWTLSANTGIVCSLSLLILNLVPFGVGLVVLARLVRRFSPHEATAAFLVAVLGFGSLCTPFLMTLNNHTVAMTGLLFSLAALLRILNDDDCPGWVYAVCGFMAAWTVCNELPAAAYGLASFLLCARKSLMRCLAWYVSAAIVPLAAYFVTMWLATGSLVPAYASFGTSKYEFTIDGVPSYWSNPQGIDRNLDSPLVYILHCTIGHHGIWSLTPVWLLSLVGWFGVRRVENRALRVGLWLGLACTVLVLGFYWSRTENYNYGGVSCGLRWALWLIPFWLIAALPVVDAWWTCCRGGRATLLALLLASLPAAWLPIPNPWQQPWLFRLMEARGWIDYRNTPPALPHDVWTLFPTIPEGDDQTLGPIVEWSHATALGAERLTLQRRGTVKIEDKDWQVIQCRRYEPGRAEPVFSADWAILADRWNAGRPPGETLRWLDAGTSREQKLADLAFLRGLPLLQRYHPGFIRYVKTPLQDDAYRCQRAAAQVYFDPGDGKKRYRVDAWFSDDVPFGAVQWDLQVANASDNTPIRLERWTLSRIDPAPAE